MASNAPVTLIPGYTQVEAFGPDEEYEGEEEVSYITLDLGATIEPTLVASSSTYRLIGLDTPTPFLQLSGTIMKGQHDLLLGTEILFTEGKVDEADRTKRPVIPVATTEQRIRFKEVQLKRKPTEPEPVPGVSAVENASSQVEETSVNAEQEAIVDRITGKSVPDKKRRRKGKKKETQPEKKAEAEGDDATEMIEEELGISQFDGLHTIDDPMDIDEVNDEM